MAHLRGDSTVGGKPIVTLDVMNTFVEQIQGVGLKAKINKYEEDRLSSLSDADTIIVDKEMNGFWQVDGTSTYNGMHPQGQLANLSNTTARFQMYAPVREGSSSALYFRTGEGSTIRPWERVVTNSILTEQLKTKVDSSNGTASNLTISDQLIAYGDAYIGQVNLFRSGFFIGTTDIGNSNASCAIAPSSNNGIWLKAGSSGLYVEPNAFKYNNYSVWHSGNFNPNDYVSRTAELLTASTDLNTVKNTGYYRCSSPTNAPSKITGWAYIEVIKHSDTYALQKIYSYDGNYTYSRTLNNGTWTTWTPLGGGMSFTKDITSGNWSSSDGMYEMTVTHNLGSENITSVIVTDSNKISMVTGFQIISSTVIKVFSATNTSGKIVINAIL